MTIQEPVDWLNSTNEERKKLYPVAKAIKDLKKIKEWNEFLNLISISDVLYGDSFAGLFSSGRISRKVAAEIYSWIAANHPQIGRRLAPDIFQKSLLTPWNGFIAAHGQYGALSTVNPEAMGLTQRDGNLPEESDPIPFGRAYCFSLNCEIYGVAIALEAHEGGEWHPIALGATDLELAMHVNAGKIFLPWNADQAKPLVLRERSDDGLQQFIVLLSDIKTIGVCEAKIFPKEPIHPTVLDEIAHSLSSAESKFYVHRVNVNFVS